MAGSDRPGLAEMFWKNTAWSWVDAAGDEDDDGGFLLAADLRRTPDPAPDADPILAGTDWPIRTSSSGPKVSTKHSVAPGGPISLDSDSSNVPSVLYGSDRLEVSKLPTRTSLEPL